MEDFNDGEDGDRACRMRTVNPEQFYTLVKMHLSFELDINTDENDPVTEKAKLKKKGLLNFSKKPKSTMNLQQKMSEGGTLTLEGINQVMQLIEYLSSEQCICQEGIFRRTGKLTRQQELKSALYQGLPLNFENGTYSVHDCASVLKGFLAELPEPLLTELHYPAYCQIVEKFYSNESKLATSIQLLLLLLPPVYRILLKHLLNLLNKTATFESSNKMNCDTLATLFTPHLMCPRKLSPEALHINSQILSCLVAFMIKKNEELFEIPAKLATDIRAYWVEQERKMLTSNKKDLNESVSDTTGTAHTVFSFVDHKLTAKANTTEDTQAALAQLYAHIQKMPESAKKRRLVKHFNKENGQGTPRHVKQLRTKSLGDSIKKHIFQKKLLGSKKFIDINIGCNINRSSSEENILSGTIEKSTLHSKKLFSKSDDELSTDSFSIDNDNLIRSRKYSNSVGNISSLFNDQTEQNKVVLKNIINIRDDKKDEDCHDNRECPISPNHPEKFSESFIKTNQDDSSKSQKVSEISRNVRRYHSEPIEVYVSQNITSNQHDSIAHRTHPNILSSKKSNFEVVYTPRKSMPGKESNNSLRKNDTTTAVSTSPIKKNKLWNVYGAHTSTPSNLLRRSLANNEYGLTPLASNDKSMSPITQSTTKMTKAMQETMMTPRSRKPVMVISGTNLCNLVTLDENRIEKNYGNCMHLVNIDIDGENSPAVSDGSSKKESVDAKKSTIHDNTIKTKENIRRPPFRERNFVTSIDDDFTSTIQPSSVSITSTFREYLLSRSVLTASPVDLSFTSRTGDFEQSESDLNILNEEGLSDSLMHCLNGNNPNSDTSGIASGSTNSANHSTGKIEATTPSPRKRGTSLHRNDSKRSVKGTKKSDEPFDEIDREKSEINFNESCSNSDNLKDMFQETSF